MRSGRDPARDVHKPAQTGAEALLARSTPVRFATPLGPWTSDTIRSMENGLRILIVDDHPSFRRCARALLEATGFRVQPVTAALGRADRFALQGRRPG